jgi:hypothetical protein
MGRPFVEDGHQAAMMRTRDPATPASLPSLAWSNFRLGGQPATQSPLMSTYHGPSFDRSLLLSCFRDLPLEAVCTLQRFETIAVLTCLTLD